MVLFKSAQVYIRAKLNSIFMATVREKKQLMGASEMDRTLVRLAHEILEKSSDLNTPGVRRHQAARGVRWRSG